MAICLIRLCFAGDDGYVTFRALSGRALYMHSPRQSGRSAAWELAACDPLTPCKRLNGLFNAHPEETC